MLRSINFYDFTALSALATGPFSHRYQRPSGAIIQMTDYPAPDGGWTWETCPASEWTPELVGYPPSKNT